MSALIDSPKIGTLSPGARDSIADVAGVTVGHVTLAADAIQTGVTVVRPHAGDPFGHPVPAAAVVINGFGKTAGLMQLNELGVLESPITLTNTFAVGTMFTAMVRHAVAGNPAIGRGEPTPNPVVAECNDGWLNDLQAFAVDEASLPPRVRRRTRRLRAGSGWRGPRHVVLRLERRHRLGVADRASERMERTVGALVLANFGRLPQLIVRGVPIGRTLAARRTTLTPARSRVDHRRARDRCAARSPAASAARDARRRRHRAHRVELRPRQRRHRDRVRDRRTSRQRDRRGGATPHARVPDDALDPLFDAAAESTEQSIVNALFAPKR